MTLDAVPGGAAASLHSAHQRCIPGTPLYERAHICAFFSSAEEEYRTLLPFIREGLECNEKAVHTIDPHGGKAHTERLVAGGIDVDGLQRNGRLEVRDWTTAHLRDGKFDPIRTLQLWADITTEALRDGYSGVRFISHMEWALESGVSLDEMLKYEAAANFAWMGFAEPVNPATDGVRTVGVPITTSRRPKRAFGQGPAPKAVVVCSYDLTKFSAEVVIEVMRTHPVVLIGGLLHENPFFVPPEEYLEEVSSR
jgi:hypothetical protein